MPIKLKPKPAHDNHLSLISLVVVIMLAVAGIILIIIALAAQRNAPQPNRSNYGYINMAGKLGPKPTTPVLPFSKPTELTIPAINVHASLITVGKNPDGTIQVPTLPNINSPAWYKYSPAPGEYGASIIEGHVDNDYTDMSIFFNLGKLQPGDKIMVARRDGITATFTVSAVRQYNKASFPTSMIYEPTSRAAELNLITCGGTFDSATNSYLANTVVFSILTSYKHG